MNYTFIREFVAKNFENKTLRTLKF